MSKAEKFEDLTIWQDARILVNHIYQQFSTTKDWSFRDQIQRAAISVMNNIAEGFERNSDKDFRRFLIIAKASCGEVRSMLYIARDIDYISKNESIKLKEYCLKISASIGSFIKYLEKSN
jgi:four helix bundle protein